ncbi:MAG: hypothetical protein ACRELB_21570, partial [Polyangiaceae bacterium]
LAPLLLAVCAAAGCVGTTGGQIVTFSASVAGAEDATTGQPYAFTSDLGWNVVLTKATLHVGAVYLDQSEPVSGSQGTNCILPGTYVAEVVSGVDVDLLSPDPQPFPAAGQGTTIPPALVGQVWLTQGDVNQPDNDPVLVIAGTAEKAGTSIPFEGKVTIGTARQVSGASAGGDPICKEHIVSPIPTTVSVGASGSLLLRVNPKLLFVNVDFSQLAQFSDTYGFSDDPTSTQYTQPSRNLYLNLHSAGALYTFSWTEQ